MVKMLKKTVNKKENILEHFSKEFEVGLFQFSKTVVSHLEEKKSLSLANG